MISPVAAASAAFWRESPPVLSAGMVTLREIELRDAQSLHELITAPEVARFIHEPPATCEAFERFITWAQNERRRGRFICFALVPHGMETAVGLFHIRRLDTVFGTAEWGFVLGSAFWGTGIFADAAELMLDFAFEAIGVTRLEARVVTLNGRGNGALRKLGAVQEAVLRKAFAIRGECFDQTLWSIVDTDRLEQRTFARRKAYVH
jgi:RimJ/RimL family protein N-acetyltransferase